ncbi:hypothetical protein ACOMHN_019875 [Nucella lapillus]
MLFLEIALGQFTRRGAVGIWDICPLMRGIGYCTLLLSAISCVYYNIIMAWVGYFFVLSFFPVLPWTHCNHDWNTAKLVSLLCVSRLKAMACTTSAFDP